MAKPKTVYVCSACGNVSVKWQGRCPDCGGWDTYVEQIQSPAAQPMIKTAPGRRVQAVKLQEIAAGDESRYTTGLSELDRVLGGGLVKGSLVLLSGDPGIGKSTILLQMCGQMGQNLQILYVSGEESQRQLKLRAQRLGVNPEHLLVMTETDVETINDSIISHRPDLVLVDSIQTMCLQSLNSVPGSIAQVRECTNAFLHTAKSMEIPMVLVGHVNKDGAIAGPKVLEHIVDAVLYFEGEKNMSCRILRAAKNRFGSTNEIGMFEMADSGLRQVLNPSAMLISGRPKNVPGTCVACVMEGSRPVLAEVQGLVAKTAFGNPRRTATGFDFNRMNLLLAVLEKRGGYYFSGADAYVNVAGGLRLDEPAADLPVALSLISSLKDTVLSEQVVAFGEIGLAGEIRAVSNAEGRILEAARLGFTKCVLPIHNVKGLSQKAAGAMEIIGVRTLRKAFEAAAQ